MISWIKRVLFKSDLDEIKRIELALKEKVENVNTIYSTAKSFKGINVEYYSFVCELLQKEEYRYMLFDIRESVIKGMAETTDKELFARCVGRLDTINIIDNYLKRYKQEYEDSIRGNS